jgi:hypothetical protein
MAGGNTGQLFPKEMQGGWKSSNLIAVDAYLTPFRTILLWYIVGIGFAPQISTANTKRYADLLI